ncbi:hypothetical protein I7I53_11372 [Histoplasma capsulatum var. duboisii H88]|uniref:Uncharacterized protein n=1 Tax=Ajellomyces capsulatus (strain H88) TaxID=544711 RepID=A0A8A1L9I5_AJEC8|nr:hypothetical protein I7I53_11372 [Histoplasma capsulatum var. duboisii H88]
MQTSLSPLQLSLISSCIHNLSGLGLDSVACTFLYPTFLLFTLTLVLRCADHTVSCPNAIQPPIAVSGANRVTPGGGVVSEPTVCPERNCWRPRHCQARHTSPKIYQ